jgi:GNAT superfamily N-acetyltransferase
MVRSVPPQPEQQMVDAFSAIDYEKSRFVGSYLGDSVWMSNVKDLPDAIGYWIGELPEFYAYLIVRPITLGSKAALEAVRAWVDPNRRKQGMHAHLLEHAAQANHQLIVGDRDGMTADAFAAWHRLSGFSIMYYDVQTSNFVEEASVPEEGRHTAWSNGDRWLIVLERLT